MTEFLIGCDPELFVKKNGKLVSAYGLIPGTKHAPFEVEGGAVQVDGMALEFNISPARTAVEFNDNINKVLGHLKQMIGPEYEFDFSPVAAFGQKYIDEQPDEAKELGCDPDYNVYTNSVNPKPNSNLGIRTASGHIHIGWTSDQDVNDPDHIEACQMVVKQLDMCLGLGSMLWDRDTTRTKMYGLLGTYRVKPYGVEYRTPSNVWVKETALRKIVFNLAITSVQKLLEGKRLYEHYYSVEDFKRYSMPDKYIVFKELVNMYKLLDKNDMAEMATIFDNFSNNPYVSAKKNTISGRTPRRSVAEPAIPVWGFAAGQVGDAGPDIQPFVDFPEHVEL